MRWIASETCKVRVRGKGSGHLEGKNGDFKEADAPLQLTLSCASPEELELTVAKVRNLLEDMTSLIYINVYDVLCIESLIAHHPFKLS